MRIVFMGTPQLAATILESLCDDHDVVGVFTRPDAVRGRGKKLVASPVKEVAIAHGLNVYTARSLDNAESIDRVAALKPDAICVAAYGALLPKEVLEIPIYGCFNVHTSLLPRWRGAAPIERAIIARDESTGVCIMRMEEGLDTGPYCIKREIPIRGAYLDELSQALAKAGSDSLVEALRLAEIGEISWTDQSQDGVSYARKIEKGELDPLPEETVESVDAKIRASNASHPSRMVIAGRPIAIERASVVEEFDPWYVEGLGAGEAMVAAKRLVAGASNGIFEIERVKPDGKKSMEGRAFAAGLQMAKGARVNWGRA